MALLNLIPISPLDGYKILFPWSQERTDNASLIRLLLALITLCFISPFIFIVSTVLLKPLGISENFLWIGFSLFNRWYLALPFLAIGSLYFIYQPKSVLPSLWKAKIDTGSLEGDR
jgi:uncharacterized BrkB/YihY/UPF0761 family membrane protein